MKDELKKKKTNAKRRALRRVKKLIWTLVILLVVGVAGFFCKQYFDQPPEAEITPVSGKEVQIHFIDVGQGDAALIRTTSGDILIDAGDNSAEDALKAYLDKYRVDDLAYVVFTHPDADHIGGADVVLENYDVERVIRPDVEVNTKVNTTMVDLIKAEGCEDIHPDVGDTFTVGEVKFTVLAPKGDKYSSRNDYSVVLRMDYGETSILFTGDAEAASEQEMLEKFGNKEGGLLDCDIIKVGHHGSDSSSGEDFIDAVTPELAIISCGMGNKYNHPDGEIVDRYGRRDVTVRRTDLEGSIVFSTNGEEIETLAA